MRLGGDLVLTTALLFTLAAVPAAPWDGAPFDAAPADVLKAASALPRPADATADLLLEEHTWAFDAQQRATFTYRLVFRPLTSEAAADWAHISMAWDPWHEERPEIRARVIGASGQVHTLDPSTFTEAGAEERGSEVYSDRRVLRAPIPAVEPGAVVEEVVILRERAPEFEAGVARRFFLGRTDGSIRRVRFRIETAAEVPVLWRAAGGLSGAPREARSGGRRVLTWEWRDVARREPEEASLPPDAHPDPLLTFTTAKSWEAIAAAYSRLVEGQLDGEELAAVARAVVAPGDSREVAAQKLLDWMSSRVRYTGLELDQAAVVPAKPSETLRRRYGDCKDLALLLSGLLRAAGHPATLALLRTSREEVDPGVPGFGLFDHAIVYLPGPRPLFIDATSPFTPVGSLPLDDQGRLALVASPGVTGLTGTPEATATDNDVVTIRDIVLSERGLSRATQTVQLRGAAAARVRAWRQRAAEDAPAMRKDDEKRALSLLNAKKYVGFSVEGPTASAPVTLRSEADESLWGVVNGDGAESIATLGPVFEFLPSALVPDAQSEGASPAPDRRGVFWLDEPVTSTLRYHVVPPPGFRPAPLPRPERRSFGPLAWESTSAAAADGSVTVEYRVTLDARRIAPADLASIRAGIAELTKAEEPKIRFRLTSAELLDAGKGREALEELRRLSALHPAEARYHNLLSMALLRLGMGDAARREARRSVELEPRNEWSHRVLSFALANDLIGRYLRPGCELAGAVASQRRAVELEAQASSRARLAFLLEHGARCERFAADAKLAEAIEIYRAIHDEKSTDYDADYAEALVAAGRFAEARELARPLKPGQARTTVLLVAAAAEGPAALAREVALLSPIERSAALAPAWRHLARRRMYPELAALLRAASAGLESSAALREVADVLAGVRQHDDGGLDPADPRALPRRIYRAILADDPERALAPLLLPPADKSPKSALDDFREWKRGLLLYWRAPEGAFLDLIDGTVKEDVLGDPETGVRIRLHFPGEQKGADMIALKQAGVVRLAVSWARFSVLAASARKRLEAGDVAGARGILALVPVRDLSTQNEENWGSSLHVLWPHGPQADADELRDAAAALEAAGSAEAIPRLAALRRAAPEGARRSALTWALAAAYYNAKRWDELLAVAEEAAKAEPSSAGAFRLRAQALAALHREDALRAAAEARLQTAPEDADALSWLGRAALFTGDLERAERP
jgi:transglutaminase-like putative cysteine protease